MYALRRGRQFDMAEDRAALLCQPGHVDHATAKPLDMGCHAEDGTNGDNAGAADAIDQNAKGPLRRNLAPLGLRQGRPLRLQHRPGRSLFDARPRHGDKRRAKTIDAGKILIAAGLVNLALAAKFSVKRLH